MHFPQNKFEIQTVVAKKLFNNVRDLIYGRYIVHHSHVTSEIIGYAHDFCDENRKQEPYPFICTQFI